ncbi:cell division inhibitor MinD [Halobacteriales archaeon SW_6_65_46]|nr:MAG: cell division inhibitor MinD [Halobacteriales archaeon SW_6_65_46]
MRCRTTLAVLAVAGGKGGVGRTATTLGLAAAAARVGYAPVVVDANRDCPDLARRAGGGDDGVAALAGGESLSDAGVSVDGVTVVGARPEDPPDSYETALARLETSARPVFIDAPAGAGPDATRSLRFASRTVLTTRATERAVRATEKTDAMARRLGAPPIVTVVTRTQTVGPATRLRPALTATIPAVDRPAWRRAGHAYDRLWRRLAG